MKNLDKEASALLAAAPRSRHGPKCRVGSSPYLAVIARAKAQGGENTQIARGLVKVYGAGAKIPHNSIARHFRGECSCADR